MVQAVSDLSMASNPEIIEAPIRVTKETVISHNTEFRPADVPSSTNLHCFDELWEMADIAFAEFAQEETTAYLPPLLLPEPMDPIIIRGCEMAVQEPECNPLPNSKKPLESEDPVSMLRIAGQFAAVGRQLEARRFRTRAMALMQVVT